MKDEANQRRYVAMAWTDVDKAGQRVIIVAASLKDAKQKLEAEFGEGNVFDLHNEEDAAKPR